MMDLHQLNCCFEVFCNFHGFFPLLFHFRSRFSQGNRKEHEATSLDVLGGPCFNILDCKKNKRPTIHCQVNLMCNWGKKPELPQEVPAFSLGLGRGFLQRKRGIKMNIQQILSSHPTLHMNACDLICSDAAARTD